MRQVEQLVQRLSSACSGSSLVGVADPEIPAGTGLRIGELSRRVGVTPDVLRAWERRYGLLRPQRSRSGQRLYSAADEARVRGMLGHIERGYSPAVAARLAAQAPPSAPSPAATPDATAPEATLAADNARAAAAAIRAAAQAAPAAPADLPALAGALRTALLGLDEAGAEAALDRLLAGFALDTVLRDVVLPFLHDLGDAWARGAVSVGQEHFASAVLAGRLHALARGWDAGVGPRAILACPSDERHELGLLCFALALRGRGWRVSYLGADTPADAIRSVAAALSPELIVLGAVRAEPLVGAIDALAGLDAAGRRLCLGGRGASPALAARLGAEQLPDDPIAAADLVSAARNA
jgi:MerR family transcriptional regulator, light-induced transcriptional regulator